MIIIKKRPLFNSKLYTGGIYDHSYYKFLEPETREIKIYGEKLYYKSSKLRSNNYQCITKATNYYILSKNSIKDRLYKASDNIKEFEEIELKIPKEYINEIRCLFYDGINKKILITTEKNVYSVTLDGCFIQEEVNRDLLYKKITYQSQMMKDLNGYYFPLEKTVETNDSYFTCCGLFYNQKYVGVVRNGSAYLLEISKRGNLIREYFIGDNIEINSLIIKDNYLDLLVTKDKKHNYIYKMSEKHYKKKYNKNKCNICPANDLINSVALIEISLANIISIESEKIQKCLANSNDITEIVKINDSLNKTLSKITTLEKNIYNMLKSAYNENTNNNVL